MAKSGTGNDLRSLVRRIVALEKQAKRSKQPRVSYSSIEHPLQVADDDGNLRQVVGLQVDGTYGVTYYGSAAPPQPGTPWLTTAPELLTVSSFGQTNDGTPWPLDCRQIDIHASFTNNFTPSLATRVGVFDTNVGGSFTISIAPGTVYVKLVAVNQEGVIGPSSAQVSTTIAQNTAGKVLQTSPSGNRVEIYETTGPNRGIIAFLTGSSLEASGGSLSTTTQVDDGSDVVFQTALFSPRVLGAPTSGAHIGLTSSKLGGAFSTVVAINADKLVVNGDRVETPNLFLTAHPTTSGAANANIGPGGQLRESTSSERFKVDLEPAEIDPQAVLKVIGQTWRDKSEVEEDPETEVRYIGVTAEQLHDLGLAEFVTYDDEGEPYAVQYDRLFVGLLSVAQDQEARLQRLESLIDTR